MFGATKKPFIPAYSTMRCLCTLIIILCVTPLFAGDIVYFLNLGFSGDGDTFMFGQYGIQEEDSRPFAESYVVNVETNTFAPGGTARSVSDDAASLGQDGIGALFNLTHQQAELIGKYDIDHLKVGRLVYLLVNGDEPKQKIAFRDFNTGTAYTLTLSQSSRGSEDLPEAAYHIVLNTETSTGEKRSQTIGLPDYYRENVNSYAIKQVIVSPDEESVIIVVEKIFDNENGRYLRYMVETAPLYN